MKPYEQVAALRRAGFKVCISHRRDIVGTPLQQLSTREARLRGKTVSTNGGYTAVAILQAGKPIADGLACCSTRDRFDRKRGLRIALGRALKQIPEVRDALGAYHAAGAP